MGEGEGGEVSLFRFHLSPFPFSPETPDTQASTSRVVVLPNEAYCFFAVLVDAAIVVAPKCGSNVSGC